jgi:hypothetical protein
MAYVTIELNHEFVRSQELTGAIEVGRSPECGLYFPNRYLSRRHLRLEESVEGWRAIDLVSTNGTWLNGEKITNRLLRDGDTIELDTVTLKFSVRSPTPARSAVGNWALSSGSVASHEVLKEQDIDELLNRARDDSVDEDPASPGIPVVPGAPEAAPATAAIAPAQDRSQKIRSSRNWDLAIKPVTAKAGTPAPPSVGIVSRGDRPAASEAPKGGWTGILVRFETDARFKGAVTIGLLLLLGVGSFYWLGANGFIRTESPRTNASAPGAHVQAPSPTNVRDRVADVPV